MTENEHDTPSTSPPDDTHEATTPPGTGDLDEEAAEKAEDDLEQAGGGH
jgi:hypothetical protein